MTNPKLHPLSLLPPTTLLYQTLTQRCVTQTCRQERVSSQLRWGWGLAVPGVKQQWMALFFSVTLNGLPSIWAGRCGLRGQYGGSVYVPGGGCHLAVTQSAKYNITTVVGLCGVCVCSVPLRRKGPALLSVFPLSLPDTRNTFPSSDISPVWVETRVPGPWD